MMYQGRAGGTGFKLFFFEHGCHGPVPSLWTCGLEGRSHSKTDQPSLQATTQAERRLRVSGCHHDSRRLPAVHVGAQYCAAPVAPAQPVRGRGPASTGCARSESSPSCLGQLNCQCGSAAARRRRNDGGAQAVAALAGRARLGAGAHWPGSRRRRSSLPPTYRYSFCHGGRSGAVPNVNLALRVSATVWCAQSNLNRHASLTRSDSIGLALVAGLHHDVTA